MGRRVGYRVCGGWGRDKTQYSAASACTIAQSRVRVGGAPNKRNGTDSRDSSWAFSWGVASAADGDRCVELPRATTPIHAPACIRHAPRMPTRRSIPLAGMHKPACARMGRHTRRRALTHRISRGLFRGSFRGSFRGLFRGYFRNGAAGDGHSVPVPTQTSSSASWGGRGGGCQGTRQTRLGLLFALRELPLPSNEHCPFLEL